MAPSTAPHIDKLDFDQARWPLLGDDGGEGSPSQSTAPSIAGSFFEQIVEGIQERDREKMKTQVARYASFVIAILSW